MRFQYAILLIALFTFAGCAENLQKVPEEKFEGIWEINGAGLLNGVQVEIELENERLVGRLFKLNDNKYVNLFCDSSAVFLSGIERSSNFEFKLTEKRIGSELFALYGLKTSQEFKAQFIDDNTIGLSAGNADPLKASRIYSRVTR